MQPLTAPLPEGVEIVARYRCIGKVVPGKEAPNSTTAVVDAAEAVAAGVALLRAGVWSEFYVKQLWSIRIGTAPHGR